MTGLAWPDPGPVDAKGRRAPAAEILRTIANSAAAAGGITEEALVQTIVNFVDSNTVRATLPLLAEAGLIERYETTLNSGRTAQAWRLTAAAHDGWAVYLEAAFRRG